MVLLKRIRRKVHPYEVEITQSFSKEPMKSHPHNHCIPLFDVLDVPDGDDTSIIVLPLLRLFDDPSFQTIGEVVEFIRQIFEGLQFMHEAHVAHRPMYPDMYHPRSTFKTRDGNGWARHYTRTRRPVKYYLIDFGLSRRYAADDVSPLEVPIRGGDKSVPEFRSDEPCNPFPTDIYYVGNMIRENFLQKPKGFAGFEFMSSLVNDMVQDDPSKRPTIDQVVARFDQLIHSLSCRWDVEDGMQLPYNQVIDATRLSDGGMVILKRIRRKVHPYEVDISEMFSEDILRSHPRNHCVPALEVLDVPDEDEHSLLVLPLLRPSRANDPRFKTRGEALEFFRQVFEGLQFMHECHVAHRDCMHLNIMMDPRPMYPQMYHPQAIDRSRDWYGWADHHDYTRTARPVKYYFIDLAYRAIREFHKSDEPCDPFPTDIYYLGSMIREYFLQKLKGFDFMEPLINDMGAPKNPLFVLVLLTK
ncbi:hypothetical protein EUX98_g9032 [Antrodiella citrinella]|uniref:Protein kinase domain-containing protein n=1 Tax=Antrodiella citrinella TaxID=2447956 RepID=A0A4S4LZD0_9APHY|nr:hypothetical protein EUX98_g9032 [Antrodiella citrinella]